MAGQRTVAIAGCGALGSQIAWHIADPELSFILIDDDRVAEENVVTGTSIYSMNHIGAFKAVVLGELLYRRCGAESEVVTRRMTMANRYTMIGGADLIVCSFDNTESRALLVGLPAFFDGPRGNWFELSDLPTQAVGRANRPTVLQVGVSARRTGAIIWDEAYVLPAEEEAGDPVCTNLLGRKILRFTSAVASGIVEEFLETGNKRSVLVTESMKILE